jgi:hypothetical protein
MNLIPDRAGFIGDMNRAPIGRKRRRAVSCC